MEIINNVGAGDHLLWLDAKLTDDHVPQPLPNMDLIKSLAALTQGRNYKIVEVADGDQSLRGCIRDGEDKLLLNSHDQFNGVESHVRMVITPGNLQAADAGLFLPIPDPAGSIQADGATLPEHHPPDILV